MMSTTAPMATPTTLTLPHRLYHTRHSCNHPPMVDTVLLRCYNCCMNYDAFVTTATTAYGVPSEILQVVRPWVESELTAEDVQQMQLTSHTYSPDHDLGYAELSSITTVPEAMRYLNLIIKMASDEDTAQKSQRARAQFLRDAGGRVGKHFYRYTLKAYYLTQLPQ